MGAPNLLVATGVIQPRYAPARFVIVFVGGLVNLSLFNVLVIFPSRGGGDS